MSASTTKHIHALATAALSSGKLLPSAHSNLADWLQPAFLPKGALNALHELASQNHWEELNDRFFKKLAFGTGGIRGRTIGRISAPSELGSPSELGTPAYPAVGSNNLNDFTLIRATIGLYRYVVHWLSAQEHTPRLVIAHDTRHFSRHFCELVASTWSRLGGEAFIFDGPRSTPQLSFTVRYLHADAGIVITASHNPPPYNGFKCYFNDGAQVVPPHDTAIISTVNTIALSEIPPFLAKNTAATSIVPSSAETAYLAQLGDNVLDKGIIARARPKIVYTNLHGTGDIMIIPALRFLGADATTVPAQLPHDPRFPSVSSPNPEDPNAFTLALELAHQTNADIVIATDPDDDRAGAAARERDGSYRLLSGNLIGSALASYRITQMKKLGIIPQNGSPRAALIKTFVTTPLQDAIAAAEHIRCVNTLTGFKWIGAKLRKYETQLETALLSQPDSPPTPYNTLSWRERSQLAMQHSAFFIFGGEESYGYLGTDGTRDKDANAATLMIAELAAWLKENNLTFSEYLDQIYLRCGYHTEALLNIAEEGATGATRIRNILNSLRSSPPKTVDNASVIAFHDFGSQVIHDSDKDIVPNEDFYFFTLSDGRRFAVRSSGTEPKIKYYLFAGQKLKNPAELDAVKKLTATSLINLQKWLLADAASRANPTTIP
ncbi:MAG: phospho-sugar mutase [Puniceicoccales bacterium]|jgi:phosphoglucomutase|nr:phospho-sugar mutase [Puniceicoccales bacterium]